MCGSNKPKGKDVNITLTVEAKKLYTADPQPISQPLIDTYCSLKDDNSGAIPPGQTLNDFTSQVYSKHNIYWWPANKQNDDYVVEITGITNNDNFFKSSPTKDGNGYTVKLKDKIGGMSDTYTISFNVIPPTGSVGGPLGYNLDPKLKGNA